MDIFPFHKRRNTLQALDKESPLPDVGQPLAAFDFDGTLSVRDSLRDFAMFSVGFRKCVRAHLTTVPTVFGWMIGCRSRQDVKVAFLRSCWAGMGQSELEAQAELYAVTRLPRLVRPAMLAQAREHKRHGHRLVLVSASPSIYLKPWACAAGFDAVLATELAFSNGFFNGQLATPNCWGPEKVARLANWFGERNFRLTYAYGDSRGDAEMLACSQFPWLRGRDQALPNLDVSSTRGSSSRRYSQ